ncbi:asparagine synthase (glutamine-hydrolyzing) [Hymenobacter busanensis]|uniref:asparagine synthase (glutamine-hydrolyzing) n=1 Tax=Hymenobacter busanensis TaxID=2607656 RepID=A0A7L4ZW13_9BACT|nr:asparagine synthase (glutamine-hydrolyzing) [Hymenobacter busanensis]KAA9332252.1 asparagine synthase (glutamine-hydrolyzing) [Hymenobacter busanensis]QHJ07411.1 asparagine synthase (glutamine-hydrolyzing) [Hymenobacter busanensis]
MCGITGLFAFNDSGRSSLTGLQASTDAIVSRGPDSQGHFVYDCVGLGFRRLAILDLSADGNQPMTDESGRYTIVFNGEIFNFRELRARLQRKGYTFRSHTDTEVILKLYITEGRGFLKKLNGFFGLAIYDKEENTLFIARDRMGVKPLLVYRDEEKLMFASEMKSLLALGVPRKLDYASLSHYLQLNYIPGPATIFKGVKKLLPGHYLFIQGNGKVVKKRWYKIPYDPKKVAKNKTTYEQQKAKLVELMDASVARRLVADVPLGSFLSGGIDSSVITALAARHTPHLNTFSIGFKDEPFFDETKYANLVAKMHKTNHTVFSLTNNDLYSHLFDVLDYFDEPFADSSALAVYILSKETRQKVTVALSGDGADELFAGYNKHMGEWQVRNGGPKAEFVTGLNILWDVLPKSRNSFFGNKVRQLQRFSRGMLSGPKDRYWDWASLASDKDARSLLSPSARQKAGRKIADKRRKDILEHLHADGDLNEVLLTDMELVLPYDMLAKVDLMSMANSLEVRTPFLDYKVVNFAFSLPVESKIDAKMKKRIVQDAFRPLLPEELYKRPKHGFEVPLLKWFRNELRPLITDDLLSDDFIEAQGIFSVDAIRALKQQLFSNNPGDVHARIWALIVFQHWWKRHMA